MFQSTPDLINRENVQGRLPAGRSALFQSTPDLINRENIPSMEYSLHGSRFQSTPDLINRENPARPSMTMGRIVSIHSRFN